MWYLIWGYLIGIPLGIALGLVLNRFIYTKVLKPKGMCSIKELIKEKENDGTKPKGYA